MQPNQEQAYNIKRYIDELEQENDLSKVGDQKVEVVVSRAFGATERLEVKATTTLDKARGVVLNLYKEVITPRALTYIKETIDYQLEADRMSRVVQDRDAADAKKANKKG